MKIRTKPFGEIEVSEKQLIKFPEGIFGFENIKEYYLIENPDSPFLWLQAKDDEDLAFIIISPYEFKPDYELKINEADFKVIELDNKDDLISFVIVTVPINPAEMTANLQGPIIINAKKRIGKQSISLRDDYTVRHSILEEMKKILKYKTE